MAKHWRRIPCLEVYLFQTTSFKTLRLLQSTIKIAYLLFIAARMAPVSQKTVVDAPDTSEPEDYTTDQSQLRQSRRASSVVVAPNMVAPSSDSRIRLTRAAQAPKKRAADTTSDSGQSTTASQAKSKAKSKAKRIKRTKKNGSLEGVSADSEGEDEAHDYNQDTDQESIEIQPRDAKAAKLKEFADILDFFEAPFKKPGDKSKKPVNFTCKWCKTPYCAHGTTKGNLYAHRDGSTQADKNPNGCVNRMKAKRSGIKLPPSVAEQRILDAKDASAQTSIMDHFQAKPAFVNRVLNQMIMIWQVRQALPWTRIEDPYLRAAFIYSNTKAVLYARRWAADESKKLYSMLKSHVFEELKVNDPSI
ncbi:hypothetical protein H4Q26_012104 [Puccinia striiformis f. sp. tritici PST-130]|nr:hypothetical protein H4Q26_012104 [Puccinia striiformis f. sp. tritici PST-130]